MFNVSKFANAHITYRFVVMYISFSFLSRKYEDIKYLSYMLQQVDDT